jgi:hypothetical protein
MDGYRSSKGFGTSVFCWLQDELNAFLRTIDDAQLKDIKFSSHAVWKGSNLTESYTAIVIYTSKSEGHY